MKRKRKRTKTFEHDSTAYYLAICFYAAQVERDPRVHPEFITNKEKEEETLQTWALEFDKLLTKQQIDPKEVGQIITFVQENKYWPRAKYSAGNLCQNYLAIRDMWRDYKPGQERRPEDIDDPQPELTSALIYYYCKLTGEKESNLSEEDKNNFRLATKQILDFYNKGKPIEKRGTMEVAVEELLHCVYDVYRNRGRVIYPRYLCSELTWRRLMPQYMSNGGVPEICIGEIGEYPLQDLFDEIGREEV